ncbi:MAG: thioredoxin domain-containing protein [Natronomonas sp.]
MENRLAETASPYLRQHADNPVAWQPWDDEALELARERDVPIFLSIGYSACHWCHVMEDESFTDPGIATLLNEYFVPIKVDREERPDVDSVYMTVCQLVRGGGGWPLSVWLTPERKPFHVGTYFPPSASQGMPGFRSVLAGIADEWNDPEKRARLESRADEWADAVTGELEETPAEPSTTPDDGYLNAAAEAALRGADREHGGWGTGQKFPQPGRIQVLARAAERTDRGGYRDVLREALDAMASGGLYDHVGGGFHRYCVDRDWTVPHFEKMLYDNAELPRAYLAGYQLTGDDRYADVVRETFAFLERELAHPDGGYYATLDAQSERDGERVEGAFYVWTPGEIDRVVDDPVDAELFRERYGVTETGNFEGRTVLTESASIESLAAGRDVEPTAIRDRLERARKSVLAARADRPRPPRDGKILAGWNGLAISALAEAGIVLDTEYGERSLDAISFARRQLWDDVGGEDGRGRLFRRYEDGVVGISGYLEDYAFLGRGAFDAYQATGDVESLAFALQLGRCIRDCFYDEADGTLYFTERGGDNTLPARPQELTDTSTPSSTGVALQFLLALSHVAPDEGFDDVVERVLETHGTTLESDPLRHASLVLAADDRSVGALELTVASDDLPASFRKALSRRYLPTRLLSIRPPTDDDLDPWLESLDLDSIPPLWRNRERREGRPTVYACRSFTCSPPQHDMDEALEWAERLGADPEI